MSTDTKSDEPLNAAAGNAPAGPPPVGLIIASMLSWTELLQDSPWLEGYWWPADGSEVPADSMLGKLLISQRGPGANRVPNLQGAVLRGANDVRVASQEVIQLKGDAETNQPTAPVYYYIRVN